MASSSDAANYLQTDTTLKTQTGKRKWPTASMVHSRWEQGNICPFFDFMGLSVFILTPSNLSSTWNLRVIFLYIRPDQLALFRPVWYSLLPQARTLHFKLTFKAS